MTRKQRGRKRKANKGSFRPVHVAGPDPRRHVFTKQDCRMGWWIANIRHPELREWLRTKLFCFYSQRTKHGQEEEHRREWCPNGRNGGDFATSGNADRDSDCPF